jgi:chaperonin GroEL
VEDALRATRAAMEEGVVPGVVVALIRALSSIAGLMITTEAMVAEAPKKEEPMAGGYGGGMGGMDF